ncbi:hypothetical protein ACFX1X_020971 [Malus domestica]
MWIGKSWLRSLEKRYWTGTFLLATAWCPVAHDFWPQRQTCKDLWTCLSILQNQDWEIVLPQAIGIYCWGSYQDCQHRELAFWVRGAQSWLKHKLDGEPFEDAVFSDGSFYLLSSDYSILKIKVANVLAAIRTEDDHEIKTDSH